MSEIVLYDYWRSSASYRVRIALLLKGLPFKIESIDLVRGDQRSKEYKKLQPQGLVPAIEIDGLILTQSLAIIEYLDHLAPNTRLVPKEPLARARVQTLSYALAMEIHPVCNLHVINHIAKLVDSNDNVKTEWMQKFILSGLSAFEVYLDNEATGDFCHGDTISMADCCLIPQLYNARRWGIDYSVFPKICCIEAACEKLIAIKDAHPNNFKFE